MDQLRDLQHRVQRIVHRGVGSFGEPVARVHAELGRIVAGLERGRTSDAQLTIADLTGVGFQDTAIASVVYEKLSSHLNVGP